MNRVSDSPQLVEEPRNGAVAAPGLSVAERLLKLTIIIPACNEEKTIAEVVRRVEKADIGGLDREIIVVDDGSIDATRAILSGLQGITRISHERNLGKGAAIKSGIQAASGDIVIVQDADMEYDPSDFKAMIAPILSGEAEFVMGSRFLREKPKFLWGGKSPFFTHYIGNQVVIWLTNWMYGQRATDYEGCYKAATRRLLKTVPIKADGFEFDNELICKVLRQKHRIVEVPIRYEPRSYQEGKKITWKHGVRMVWTILKWRVWPF